MIFQTGIGWASRSPNIDCDDKATERQISKSIALGEERKSSCLSPRRQCVSLAVQALLPTPESTFRHSTPITAFSQDLEVWQNTTPVAVSPGFESRNEFKMWPNHSQQIDRTDFHASWVCPQERAGWGLWPALTLRSAGVSGMHVLGDGSTDMMETNTNLIAHGVWRAIKTLWYRWKFFTSCFLSALFSRVWRSSGINRHTWGSWE